MLTGYPQDVEGAGEVEDVIPKSEIRKSAPEYVARILRSMQRYEEAMTDRQKRLNDLIDRKLAGDLTKAEERELQELRKDIERPYVPELLRAKGKREKAEEDEMKLLQRISERLSKIEESAKKSGVAKKTSRCRRSGKQRGKRSPR